MTTAFCGCLLGHGALIAYADNAVIVKVAKSLEAAREILKQVMFLIKRWIRQYDMALAP